MQVAKLLTKLTIISTAIIIAGVIVSGAYYPVRKRFETVEQASARLTETFTAHQKKEEEKDKMILRIYTSLAVIESKICGIEVSVKDCKDTNNDFRDKLFELYNKP